MALLSYWLTPSTRPYENTLPFLAFCQDRYYLGDKASGAKLPTYEDCIKADRDLMVDLSSVEHVTKASLARPTLVVLEPVPEKEIKEEDNVA